MCNKIICDESHHLHAKYKNNHFRESTNIISVVFLIRIMYHTHTQSSAFIWLIEYSSVISNVYIQFLHLTVFKWAVGENEQLIRRRMDNIYIFILTFSWSELCGSRQYCNLYIYHFVFVLSNVEDSARFMVMTNFAIKFIWNHILKY